MNWGKSNEDDENINHLYLKASSLLNNLVYIRAKHLELNSILIKDSFNYGVIIIPL